jgi:hypothetical protein
MKTGLTVESATAKQKTCCTLSHTLHALIKNAVTFVPLFVWRRWLAKVQQQSSSPAAAEEKGIREKGHVVCECAAQYEAIRRMDTTRFQSISKGVAMHDQ